MYKTTLSGQVWRFDSLKTLMAKASPARSGDALAGVIATSAEERMAAKMALAEVPLTDILDNPLIPYEQDEVTRLILDTHDATGCWMMLPIPPRCSGSPAPSPRRWRRRSVS